MSYIFALLFVVAIIALPIFLIRPLLLARITKQTDISRKKITGIFSALIITLFVLIGITAPDVDTTRVAADKVTVQATQSPNINVVLGDQVEVSPSPSPSDSAEPSPSSSASSKPTSTPKVTTKPKATIAATAKPSPTIKATSTPKATAKATPKATSTPKIVATPQAQQKTATGSWSCDCKRTCEQISSCAEAQYQLNACGCKVRDNDKDGIACDNAPLNCQN